MKLVKYVAKSCSSFIFICLAACTSLHCQTPPKLTVIFVIDQFAHHYVTRLNPYFTSGLKTLLNNGIYYTDAHMPHGMTATATGHAGLSTATYAKDHGFIGNRWFDAQGNDVHCDDDNTGTAAVFKTPTTFYPYGKSARQLMVDTISDQFMLKKDQSKRHAYALSLKSRAAIATAGKLGKALWFDLATGNFTSSAIYFGMQLPDWVVTFNQKNPIHHHQKMSWKLRFPETSAAYESVNPLTYQFVEGKTRIAGSSIPITTLPSSSDDEQELEPPYNLFAHTPAANDMLLNLARVCIETHFNADKSTQMLLWVCISSTDKIGHRYGPNSFEAIDMLYHLDLQIGKFMRFVEGYLGRGRTLYAITDDHGVCPIVELMQNEGYFQARRIFMHEFIPQMNALIEEKYGISGIVQKYKTPQFYIDMAKLKNATPDVQEAIIADLRKFLEAQEGIKKTWTYDELSNTTYEKTDLENFFKQQLFPGRSGLITLQTYPYCLDTKWPYGTDHRTPYDYDTHVPLAIYQPEVFEKKLVEKRVWALQLADTIARILGIQRPSASTFEILPGLFDPIAPSP